jgi:TIR domain
VNAAASELLLFISHSSTDIVLARRLVGLFEKALKLSARQIRCTSVDGYRLPVGADADEQLRREIFVARAFIAILTPASLRSPYVLFELGARWGAKRHLAPVLARGSRVVDLGGPLTGLNVLNLLERGQTLQLVQDVGEYLDQSFEPMAAFENAVSAVIAEASAAAVESASLAAQRADVELDDDEIRVLQFFATIQKPSARDVAAHLRVPEQKARFFIDQLRDKNMISYGGTSPHGSYYYLAKQGRAALVKRQLL